MTTFLTFNRENPIHRIKSYLGSGSVFVSESGFGSIITNADPRIRIRIKMIRIRNTGFLILTSDNGKKYDSKRGGGKHLRT